VLQFGKAGPSLKSVKAVYKWNQKDYEGNGVRNRRW